MSDTEDFIFGQILHWGNRQDLEMDDGSYNSWTAERAPGDSSHNAWITVTDDEDRTLRKFLVTWSEPVHFMSD